MGENNTLTATFCLQQTCCLFTFNQTNTEHLYIVQSYSEIISLLLQITMPIKIVELLTNLGYLLVTKLVCQRIKQ